MEIKYSIREKENKTNGLILSEATKLIFETDRDRRFKPNQTKLIISPNIFEKLNTRRGNP